jgi:hypothetical protein
MQTLKIALNVYILCVSYFGMTERVRLSCASDVSEISTVSHVRVLTIELANISEMLQFSPLLPGQLPQAKPYITIEWP